ncbi:MAG: hypothetical protein BEN18_02995 [Epulopiscium sp. Nuni2H_MBin001]|nr:MAG: hypothetical protein BEN18_02995 [Epulopiscium sp. Nuni2H_MBin001]
MRIRGQFTKEGNVKFVGHLDTMRMFQRAIKMAKIPVAYSEGFNPHSKIYFAMPLSVGVSSVGEYIEIRTKEDIEPEVVQNKLNAVLPRGVKLKTCFEVQPTAPTLMSQVDVADYIIKFEQDYSDKIEQTLCKEEIPISKRNKKKKWVDVDIKPLIINYEISDAQLKVKLYAGSKQNLNVDLLLKAIFGEDEIICNIERIDLYTNMDNKFISLSLSDKI